MTQRQKQIEFRGKVYEIEVHENWGTWRVQISAKPWTMGKAYSEDEAWQAFYAALKAPQQEWVEAHPHWGERPEGLTFTGSSDRLCKRCEQGHVRKTNVPGARACDHCFGAWDCARDFVAWGLLAHWAKDPEAAVRWEAFDEVAESFSVHNSAW